MSYTNQMAVKIHSGKSLVASAGTSLGNKITATDRFEFVLQRIVVVVTTAAGATTSAAIDVYKNSTKLFQSSPGS
jgi:hypothetical protein